ncbi:hypothetical protein VTN96DRAFT_1580 [Rasamsonia emersonii]|uniref:COP9 signalosome complex subunit 6 n=1 Tax=Rasamsonia emersonii (strain ATCC 16479 / CBS 393.64 / IMI 116815) TaxID=1408163 RepID=A0A0F4YUP8_RASE3|nr:COP9 signalosome subunit 6 (CsnF) [Rasamsonia emersonii CBS 393.64]KKA21959.1 COP9 signalosome subunit 6 (CsnF) [Rasamsonia emersonii CBS 393.64]
MAESSSNPLISSKPSDSGLHVQLHPLVLLTISDHITRHTARQQQDPIVGALLGQQQGREISLEYAFECHTITGPNDEILLHQTWFEERVKQYKDVHKSPALDLVGWFTTTPPSGPDASHLPIHRQILHDYNESAVFLAFHPSLVQSPSTNGAKLPLTIYESVFEGENVADADKVMQVDGEEQSLNIRFRELPYSVETGEAEMISIDSVARGGGNAMAIEAPGAAATTEAQSEAGKKKRHAGATEKADGKQKPQEATSVLSPEDEDLIASLTTRLNAVKTLESRIRLIKSYLANLPPSFLDGSGVQSDSKDTNTPGLSYPILRNIQSLISGLSLLAPQDEEAFAVESLAQENDVTLVSLLGLLGENVQHMRELGKKSAIVESTRQSMASSRKALQSRFENELREGAFPGAMHVS